MMDNGVKIGRKPHKRGKGRQFAEGNPGRPKGAKNKFTSLRSSFLEVFEKLGGTQGLLDWCARSSKNQAQFYSWVTKMLPSGIEISSPDGGPVSHVMKIIVVNTDDPGDEGEE